MNIPRKHRISTIYSGVIIVVVTIIILVFTGFLILDNIHQIEVELQHRLALASDLARKTLAVPIWELNFTHLNDFIQALRTDRAVVYVNIIGSDHVSLASQTYPDFAQKDWAFFTQSSQFLTSEAEIIYQNTTVGVIQMAVSKVSLRQEIRRRIVGLLAFTVVLILAILLASFVVTKRYILRPLSRLLISATTMTNGNFEAEIDTSGKNEFGMLARNFMNMRDAIRNMINDLARERNLLRTLIDNLPDFIYVKDRDSRFLIANQAVVASMQVASLEALYGKSDLDLLPAELATQFYQRERQIIEADQRWINQEERSQDKETGAPIWLLTTKVPFRDGAGQIAGLVGISRDITELKQTQEKLQALNAVLEERVNLRTAELASANAEIQELNAQLTDENLRMRTEMSLARRIQTSLLPQAVRNIHPDFAIAATMLPADEVGGDYYDVLLQPDNILWLAIGDVSGHGVTPGLIMMMAQTIHATLAMQNEHTPAEAVTQVNRMLYLNVHERLQADHFMTFTTLKYEGGGHFTYAGAHLELIVFRQATQTCELIATDGVFLNFVPEIADATVNRTFALEVGDTLILYTDGLLEAAAPHQELLETARFVAIVQRHAGETVEVMRDAIMHDVLAWCDNQRDDDMTLVVVRRIK